MTVKILDIGSGPGSFAEQVFAEIPDKKIVRLDIDPDKNPDVLHNITEPLPEEFRSQFDLVLVAHVVDHIPRVRVVEAMRNVISGVRNGGEVWFLTPSLEWAASELINQRDGMHIQGLIFGGQTDAFDFHYCGFTLASLRQMVEICGLIVRKAYQSPFTIQLGEKEYGCIQNVVIGARYDVVSDPAEAIQLQGVAI
jgi:SAM-dependent methyltransferase